MTEIDERNDYGKPDNNLDRLIELGEQLPRMPEDLKARIRTRLAEVGQEPEKKNFLFRRWIIVSPLAAAVVVASFLIFFWPAGTPGTVSWADVQKKLEQVHTMAFKGYIEVSTTAEKQIIDCWKVYHMDPGLTRSEKYPPDTDLDESKPKSIFINKREPGLSENLTLYPNSNRAEWVTHIFRNNGKEIPSSQIINLASENWKLMERITADQTKRIGNRSFKGLPAVGFEFEAPAREIVGYSGEPTGQAHGQLWVGRDDGVPLFAELKFRNTIGQNVRIETSDIKWNVPLEEGLFNISVPTGWNLNRTRIESAEYEDTRLVSGIIMQIGPDGREPLVTADDVAGVVGAEQTTDYDSNVPGMMITIELKPESAKRLYDYGEEHPDQIMVVNFNGQIKVATKMDVTHTTRLSFDISLLGLSLAELETRYFTTSIERNKP